MSNTLAPLDPPFPADVAPILARYPQQQGYILSLFRTFANSPRFLAKAVPNLLDKDSPLALRTREIVILRTTANRHCEYEWGVHAAIFAKAAKLTEEQVRATVIDDDECWSESEFALIRAVDQLCEGAMLDDDTLIQFRADWENKMQLEILALVGNYTTISLVANVAGLPPEPFSRRFPANT
jgi:alkylhydroperoxidase family enzyme